MFKCKQCKKPIGRNQTQFKRRKFRILKDIYGKKSGKKIVSEKEVCFACYKKYGAIFK